jgi:sterol desaturase/sphingolipid hydroxylase (fatty acid hydroxylase superfamily)
MDELIAFFNELPTWFRALMLVGGVLIFWVLEGVIPLFSTKYKKVRHAGINLFFTFTTAVINFGLASLLVGASVYVSSQHFGLIYIFDLPLWSEILFAIMAMDLIGAYFIHWIEHKVKWLWLFHLIHHTDTNVDVTTVLRHHPGESIFRMTFTILAVIIVGAPIWMVMLYQSLSVIFTHFNHANISLPPKLDHVLSYLFVTPNMHKVHHHKSRPLTDTNYGNIFSIWDRIFGTYVFVSKIETLEYGIDTHMDPSENDRISNLLKIPFQKYRTPLK